ncbi:DUF4046 domain-containing protein [Bacillus cereus]|nr:DUF4046 domain-containing protein [Bacillus cereus]MEC2744424.1 DUF4046 domain-containing protein [Bacillus cereus]MEC2754868.1 DUF4046 domain-containing protein [Bacillus cereus]MEC2830292.1 DUF4046 domain-containing protein [Bacillus cereus]
MNNVNIEKIYQEILDGKRSRFPPRTWIENENKGFAKRVTKYLIEIVLKWDSKELKQKWSQKIIIKYKLGGSLGIVYHNSPYAMLNDLYPDCFKEWEFKSTPMKFWTKEKGLEALKWTIEEKEKLSNKQVINQYDYRWLFQHRLSTPCSLFFDDSPYKMINELYPDQFKEWEFKKTPVNFWTKKKGLEVLKWTIEKKEKLTEDKLLEVYQISWLKKHNLYSPCYIHWKASPYAMLNDLYPSRFREWEFKRVTKDFNWTKEKALEALKWTIEEKEKLTSTKIKKQFSIKWLVTKGLRTPLVKFWDDSPYAMLNELYPDYFKEWEFKSTPNKFWTKEKALEALKWTIEEKEKLTAEELKNVYSRKWIIEHKLRTPLNKFWGNNTNEMLSELYLNDVNKASNI